MKNNAIIRLTATEQIYSRTAAVRLARISISFLHQCEQEGLFPDDRQSFSVSEITQLARIRRLHEDLGLDLPTIGIVLSMRQRILELIAELEDMERHVAQREEALRSEIHRLQALIARDVDY